MGYKVEILNNKTKEKVWYSLDFDWTDGSMYWWTDGNFGCDCNRELCFERAKGTPEEKINEQCGEDKFSVIRAVLANGEEIEIDGSPNQTAGKKKE